MSQFDEACAAVQGALDAGARYADARIMVRRTESMSARDGEVEDLSSDESAGIGVRALVGSGWGFYAVPDLTEAAARAAGGRAAEIAAASALVPGPAIDLVPAGAGAASWASPCEIDPLSVPLSTKGDLLVTATAAARDAGADLAEGIYQIWDTRKWFVSSEGHRIDQHIRECGAGMTASAYGDGEIQRRSWRSHRGQYGTRGWELVDELALVEHAPRMAEEARALLTAPLCPAGETTLILGGEQLALQIHESVGHAIELDRILGWEAAYAGTSWLDLSRLGALRYGSDLMTITADATIPGALGSFGYDDEGTPAQRVDIVKDGVWVGVLSGRDSAHVAGLPPGGMVRGDGWNRLPMVRMTNVGLLPGESSLEEIVAATDDGIYMETNRSWSIDDKRLNFQFGCEMGWEIKGGKRGRLLKNPTYTAISPRFWGSMDMLGGRDEWTFWGTPSMSIDPQKRGQIGRAHV